MDVCEMKMYGESEKGEGRERMVYNRKGKKRPGTQQANILCCCSFPSFHFPSFFLFLYFLGVSCCPSHVAFLSLAAPLILIF